MKADPNRLNNINSIMSREDVGILATNFCVLKKLIAVRNKHSMKVKSIFT